MCAREYSLLLSIYNNNNNNLFACILVFIYTRISTHVIHAFYVLYHAICILYIYIWDDFP